MTARADGRVFVDVGMSLDGLIAGPNGRPGNPLGDGGTRIHRDIRVSGGADTIRQAFRAGVVDELHVHLAPVLMGEGVRLFDGGRDLPALEITAVRPASQVTHLSYRVVR